jgi:hypothetical protein
VSVIAWDKRLPWNKQVYGWIEQPSLLNGATSAFDFMAVTKWWDKSRFRGDADTRALTRDFHAVASDFRQAYYKALREHGIETGDEVEHYVQTSMFDPDAFRVPK